LRYAVLNIQQVGYTSKASNARHHPPAHNYEQHPTLRMTSTLIRVGCMPLLGASIRLNVEHLSGKPR
jgi:hypothetical protein